MEKQKILFVDDTPSLLKLGRAIFETGGYEVIMARNGVEALDLLSGHSVVLIITDILMPDMDGYSLCYHVRNNEKHKDIPIIIYSATYTSQSDEQLAIEVGANMFIRKPATMNFLLESARNLISGPEKFDRKMAQDHELAEVTRQYSARLIEKLEQKNDQLEKAHEELAKSEKRFRALVDNTFDAISLLDEKGTILYQSPATQRMTGYPAEETKGKKKTDFFHPDDVPEVLKRWETALKNPGVPIYGMNRMRHKDGHYIWTEGTTTNMLVDENVKALVGNYRDITERKLAEEKILRANRMYAFISAINQTIVHVTDEQTLYREACRIAVEIGKFQAAWMGIIDEENEKINIGEECGMSPEDIHRFSGLDFESNSCLYSVLNTGKICVCNEIEKSPLSVSWKSIFTERQWWSQMVVPIKKSDKVAGTFTLYSSELNSFDTQEILLLEEIAGDISFALDVFEKEKQRKQAEHQLIHSERHLKQAQAIAHLGSWTLDFVTGIAVWSEESCRIYGLSPGDNIQSFQSFISFIHPEDLDDVLEIIKEGQETLSSTAFHHRIILKNGTVKYIYSQAHVEFNSAGMPVGLYGVSHDETEIKEAEQKIIHANRLYAFISQINQTIVRSIDEQTVFKEACRIAIEFGKFKIAWIGIFDSVNSKISLAEQCGLLPDDLTKFADTSIDNIHSASHILDTGSYFICNDIEKDYELGNWRPFATSYGLLSSMVLPIRKFGNIYATFSLYSTEKNFFDNAEIALLEEATSDISFALDLFEKEKQRKLMEDMLLYSEQRLKQAQAIAHFGSWEFDFATGLGSWSEECCRIFGLSPNDNTQSYESFLSFIHPDDLSYVKKISLEGQELQSGIAFHHRILLKDGTLKFIYTLTQIEFDSEGNPVGLYGVSHDETEIKEAEQVIEQSEANLSLIMDIIPQSIFVKDHNGQFVFANKSFASLYGLTPGQLIRKNIREIIPVKEEALPFLESDLEVIQSGETIVMPENSFTDYKGERHLLHTVKVPFTVPGTNEKAVLGVLFDITEQKQRETERAKIIADILQRNKDLEQFSYIVSHNLRAPVANIIGLAEVVNLPGIEAEEIKEFMSSLAVTVKKLDDIVIDLNYILQLKEGINMQKEIVTFSGLLADIKLSISNIIKNENVVIQSDFSEIDEIFTLKSYIYSIFYNLITNSIKFRQPGVAPVIEIASYKKSDKLEIRFKDNGSGIDLKERGDQVFGLYKRFHPFVEGKGMGLYLTKTQVQTLGGTINVKSEVNKGTEFIIEFDN